MDFLLFFNKEFAKRIDLMDYGQQSLGKWEGKYPVFDNQLSISYLKIRIVLGCLSRSDSEAIKSPSCAFGFNPFFL